MPNETEHTTCQSVKQTGRRPSSLQDYPTFARASQGHTAWCLASPAAGDAGRRAVRTLMATGVHGTLASRGPQDSLRQRRYQYSDRGVTQSTPEKKGILLKRIGRLWVAMLAVVLVAAVTPPGTE